MLRQLIDEKLRIQEAQRRKIVIQDTQIAAAIKEIETRNGMQPGALRAKLSSDGVSTRTLIDQIRAQLAWSQMLRDIVADRIHVTRSRGGGTAEAGGAAGRARPNTGWGKSSSRSTTPPTAPTPSVSPRR